MRGVIAAFAKTPGLSPIKTRLAADIGRGAAEQLYRACCSLTAELLLDAQRAAKESAKPYTLRGRFAIAEAAGISDPLWSALDRMGQTPEGTDAMIWPLDWPLWRRLHFVYEQLLQEFDFAILIGTDSPQVEAATLLHAADLLADSVSLEAQRFVAGPALDGGFYLLGGHALIPEDLWQSVTYSSSETLFQLSERLQTIGDVERLESHADLDTASDLPRIVSGLQAQKPGNALRDGLIAEFAALATSFP